MSDAELPLVAEEVEAAVAAVAAGILVDPTMEMGMEILAARAATESPPTTLPHTRPHRLHPYSQPAQLLDPHSPLPLVPVISVILD
jgi:hypothetical protein